MRVVDQNKKSNIKCEHCKFWNRETGKCLNPSSTRKGTVTNYWNRCKAFIWR